MKDLIYYPSFEPQSLNWLKYALIYFEKFSPIVPVKGQGEVSEVFRRIKCETEIINNIEPQYTDGEQATIRALENIDIITNDPGTYGPIFGNTNIIDFWSSPEMWNTTLYYEKFTDSFAHYCAANHFGLRNNNGIVMSESLAGFYMTFLAEEIALRKQASPITDNQKLDALSTSLRIKDVRNENKLYANKVVVDMFIPEQMDRIDIERLIIFRNNPGITELRKSYNKSLDNFYDSIENDFDPYTYLEEIAQANIEFRSEILGFFGAVSILGLDSFLVSKNLTSPELIGKIIEAGMAIRGLRGVSKQWKLGQDRRNARKFLTSLNRI
jgi:hypothetical protein